MARRIRVTRFKRVHAVAMLVGLVGAALVAPAAHAGRTTDPLYNFTLSGSPSAEPTNGITSDGVTLGSYVEPIDATGSYNVMGPVGSRSFTLNLAGVSDVANVPATNYPCVSGSSLWSGIDPFVFCYGNIEKTRGFILDFPPYGNQTKQTIKLACGKAWTEGSTYFTVIPPSCEAQIWQVNGPRNGPVWQRAVPFSFQSQVRQ